MKRCFCGLSVVASLLFFLLPLATGQNDRGSITGRVTDPSGAIVAGASVKVINTGTGSTFEATTDADGHYGTPEILQVGTYRVEVSHAGFKTTTSADLDLRIGDVREVNLTLTVGQAQERVTVTTEAPIIETETSSNGDVIEGRQVTELPLRDRNFTSLALLTPGVDRAFGAVVTDSFVFNQGDPNAGGNGISDSRGDTPASRFGRSGGSAITANGLRTGNNNFTLDGVDDNEPIFGEIGVFPNPDAIQEFQVQTSLAKAESGRGGAQVNTTLKTGTNDIHGLVSYYGQNAALNATAPLILQDRITQGLTAAQLPKTQTHVNEFGGMIGGPIIKNRTFFFGDYLGQRNSIPNAFRDAVPTAGARTGDFSSFSQQLVDPGTDTNGFGFPAGTAFPGNVIPNLTSRSDFSPIAQKIFNLFPLPNCNSAKCLVDPSSSNNPNYFGTRQYKEKIDSFDIKIDHRFSNSNNANFRVTRDNQNNTRSNFFPGQLPTAGFGAGVELGNTRQVVATDTHVFTPTILNEVKFGYTSVDLGIDNCGVLGACGVSPTWCNDMGIPNCNKGTPATTGGLLLGWGGGGPPGELEFLGDGGIFQQTSHSFYVADSVTIIHGKHSWKTGFEVRPHHIDQLDSGNFGDLKGAMAWGNGGVNGSCGAACVNAGHTGVNQADSLLSVSADFSNSGTVAGGDKAFQLHNVEYAFYVQDDWKATPNLTLNLGVRWDILPLYNEVNHRIGNFDPVTHLLNRASGSQSLVNTRYDNIGPRAGFAYAFGSQRTMVLRGGVGVFYALEGFGGDYPLVLNPPNVNQVFDGGASPLINLQTGPPVAVVTDPPVLTTGTTLISIPRSNFKNETIYEGNLSFEYQFAKDYVLDIGYAGNRSRHLLAERQLGTNGNGLGAVSVSDTTFGCAGTGPCPFSDVRAFEGRANEDYDSLQAKLEKRFSAGLVGTAAYTWSHNIDNNTGLFGNPGDQRGNQGGPIDPLNFNIDRSSSALDHRHVFSGSILYDLPFGKGKRYMVGGGPFDKVVGGWQLNVILNGSTGQHFSVIGNGTGSGGSTIANIVGDPFANRPPGAFLNVNAFQDPIAGNPGTNCITNLAGNQVCWGNSGRNHFTGPGYFRTDMSLFKNTKIGERVSLQIGLEAYNLFNQDNALVPQTNIDGGSGVCLCQNPTFGTFVNTILPPRIVQYRFKVIF
jgi:outer membrane receptor protein involved in Fe transport